MLRLIRCVGRAVAVKGVRGLRGEVPFDEVLFDVAAEVRRLLNEDELRNELQDVCRPAAAEEIRRLARRVSPGVAPDLPAEVQHALANYLSFIPAAVRQALKRPDDPAGTSIPAWFPLSRPEGLLVLLPAGLPRFRPGERPAALGGWELVDLLGVDGFGEIWLAQNVRFHAIRSAVQFCLDAAAREYFLKPEGQLVRRVLQVQAQLPGLAHGDGIVPLQNADLTADPPWLRFQSMDGHNLSGLVLNWATLRGPERAGGATAVVRRLARIVGQFHRLPEPIVHRDLKPSNVLVCRGPDGKMSLRVGGYGISQVAARRAIERSGRDSPRGSMAQALRGAHTPLYVSPQQKRMQDPDVRDDVFALGVLWYQLLLGDLTLERPDGPWRERVAHLEMNTTLLDLLEECVADDAAIRPYDAAELAERLAGKPPSPPPAPPPVAPPPPAVVAADAVPEPAVRFADEVPTQAPVPPLAAPPPAILPVAGATGPFELIESESPAPTATAIPVEGAAEPATVLTDGPAAPPAAAEVDEAEVVAELLSEEPLAPPPPAVVPVVDVASEADRFADDLAAPPPATPPLPAPAPVEVGAELAEVMTNESSELPPVAPSLPAARAIDAEAELAEVWAEAPPEAPPATPPAVEVDEAEAVAELLSDEPPTPPVAAPPPTAAPEDDLAEVAERSAEEPPASPPAAVAMDEEEVLAELLSEETPAPPPAPALPVDERAEVDERIEVEPPAAPLVIPSRPTPLPVDDGAKPAEVMTIKSPEPPPATPPLPASFAIDDEAEFTEVLADSLREAPPTAPPAVAVVEDEVVAELLSEEPPEPLPTAPPSRTAIPVDGVTEVAERFWDEPFAPPANPPAVEDDVAEVMAEWLLDEPAEAPPAAPPPVEIENVAELAAVATAELPAPPSVPSSPAALPPPATRMRERFVELSIPLREGPVEVLTMRFAWIPPGAFLMGDANYEEEKPAHRVTFTQGFYLGVSPVTQAQWHAVMNYNPSLNRAGDRPVEMVSWTECQEFCRQLRQWTGKGIRLPTEAEWEYACRAGTTTEYYTGDGEEALRRAGWYQGNSEWHTHPVGQLAANAWGLYDLHGNVWEWCQDWYGPYSAEGESDPKGPDSGEVRVVRGGSWRDPPGGCRSSARGQIEPDKRFFECGCRVCFFPE